MSVHGSSAFEAVVTKEAKTEVDFRVSNPIHVETSTYPLSFVQVQLRKDMELLTYGEVLTLLASSGADGKALRSFFAKVLAGEDKLIPFSQDTLSSRVFEFVSIEAPEMGVKQTDGEAFDDKLHQHKGTHDVVQFMTPSKPPKETALLAPALAPGTPLSVYRSIGSFFLGAPAEQVDNILRKLGVEIHERMRVRGDVSKPLWVSTAGYDVAWLHLRLDDFPKYYRCKEYKDWPSGPLPMAVDACLSAAPA
jgi:hypothetical protein